MSESVIYFISKGQVAIFCKFLVNLENLIEIIMFCAAVSLGYVLLFFCENYSINVVTILDVFCMSICLQSKTKTIWSLCEVI